MESKRVVSKYTTKRSIGEAVEQTLVDFPVYADAQLFVEKDLDLTWHNVKEAFQ